LNKVLVIINFHDNVKALK